MKTKKCRLIFLWLVLAAMSVQLFAIPVNAESEKEIRVGFFAFDGYHNEDEDGNRSGYGYEYLQQMARYTGWTYDYVGYENSWSDAQKMLEDGEIDILTSAQKTPEREEKFDFSDSPIGYSSTIVTIKAGNDKFSADNLKAFDGAKIGMLNGNSRNDDFAEFAEKNGFDYKSVVFENTQALTDALQNGSIDAVVTSSLRVTTGEWIVAEFNSSPYYVCVKKGNSDLLKQVNYAIGEINANYPGIQNELANKYYGTDKSNGVAFTESERKYINDLIADGKKLKVMINPDRKPLSYYENGEMSGIFGEIAKQILEKAGLPYETVVVSDREEYTKYRDEQLVDLCMDMRCDFNYAEKHGYRVTDSYISSNISRVTRTNFTDEVKTIALVRNSDIASEYVDHNYSNAAVVSYDTGEQCVQAVRDGKQDAAILYTYVAENMLRDDYQHTLTATLASDFYTPFCVGICNNSDAQLFSILNKTVSSIDSVTVDTLVNKYTKTNSAGYSLLELVYDYPILSGAIAVCVVVLLCALFILIMSQRSARRDEERAKEIRRLFSYVCKENESVLEIDLTQMKSKYYYLNGDELCIEERPYSTEGNANNFMYPDDYTSVTQKIDMQRLNEIIQNGEKVMFEARRQGAEKTYEWCMYTIQGIVPDKSHPNNFMLFKRNINQLKVKEEESRKALQDALEVAREASAAKGSFMSKMSHEIRTPLNAVIGYMTLADDCLDQPEKVGDYIAKSQTAARHLLNIINDVLDMSAIESGKIKIASEEFDLSELLKSVSLMFYGQAKNKGVSFDVKIHNLTDEVVIGDQLRLNQILMNLLSNAMKFTSENGAVTVDVTELEAQDEQVRIKFMVTDTGIGMSKDFLGRIFNAFEQETAGTARKFGGSGLGLSITKNLVTMMKGSIEVESEVGKGTTFTVILVFGRTGKKSNNASQNDFSRLRALIVDDEKRSCDYMKSLLKRCKVKSDIVFSGEDALRQIMRREGTDYEYDLCIIDWNLTGIDGVETARQIREKCGKQMPIIIATAYDINEIRDNAMAAGVNKLISKPLFQSTMFDLLVDTYGKYTPQTNDDSELKKADFSGVHILLAEDNEMNMEIAVDILTKSGLVIDTAENGKIAYDKFTSSEKNTYQLILMDVQMPVMDGYEATKAIRNSSHPQAKNIPILAMTANAFREDVAAALAAGMNDHIAKPINYDKLYSLLQKYLTAEKKESEQQL